METKSFATCIDEVRKFNPLIHCITNYVTVNDCANAILAVGGSPLMSDDPEEVSETQSLADGLLINIGTLNHMTKESALRAGKAAKELHHCVVFDPVGCGASCLRRDTSRKIIEEVKPDIIKANVSEIRSLLNETTESRGVDAVLGDRVEEANVKQMGQLAKRASSSCGAIIAMTGAIDIVADADHAYAIKNGDPLMSRITGSGCMLGCIVASFASACQNHMLQATIGAIVCMGAAGQVAHARMQPVDGNASFRSYLIDALYNMSSEAIGVLGSVEEIPS